MAFWHRWVRTVRWIDSELDCGFMADDVDTIAWLGGMRGLVGITNMYCWSPSVFSFSHLAARFFVCFSIQLLTYSIIHLDIYPFTQYTSHTSQTLHPPSIAPYLHPASKTQPLSPHPAS